MGAASRSSAWSTSRAVRTRRPMGWGSPAPPAAVDRARGGARGALHLADEPRGLEASRGRAGRLRLLGHGEPGDAARAARERGGGRRRGAGCRPGVRAVGVLRLYAAAVPADPRARRLPASRGRARARPDGGGAAPAVSVGRDEAGGAGHGRQDASRAVRVLPRPAVRRELPHGARSGVDRARCGGGVHQGRRAGARYPDRMSPRPRPERRSNQPLRDVLDELLTHTRDVSRRSKTMTPAELEYAEQRLEWLADEVWRVATGGQARP